MRVISGIRFAALAALLLTLGGCAESLHGAFEPVDLGAKLGRGHRIEVNALPIALSARDPAVQHVGALDYRGGLYLRSPNRSFGGLSGLLVSPDGAHLIAVSTGDFWFTADLNYEDGQLAGLSQGRLAPMLDLAGKPVSPHTGKAAAVTAAGPDGFDGSLYVAFDRSHKVLLYPAQKDRFASVPSEVELPTDARPQTVSGGINGIYGLDYHTLFALSLDVRDRLGDFQGWLVSVPPGSDTGTHGILFLKAIGDYKPADIAALPNGDVFVLERNFSLGKGAGMQIRRFARADIKPYAVLGGEVIAQLDVRYSIDNMEGLAVRAGANGETLIYVLSNDNFSGLQRTVLLEFALAAPPKAAKR